MGPPDRARKRKTNRRRRCATIRRDDDKPLGAVAARPRNETGELKKTGKNPSISQPKTEHGSKNAGRRCGGGERGRIGVEGHRSEARGEGKKDD